MTTLSVQDQERSLSKGKRKRPEKAPKIVLRSPFPKYWPQVNEEDAKTIKNLLNKLLVRERPKPKIPWKTFIKLSKEIRKERTKEMYSKEPVPENLQKQRKCIKVGINAVSRAIQHLSISSCLLAADTQPDILISHLVTLASTRAIPVIIVPNLKQITIDILGFSCAALGFSLNEDGYFEELVKSIKELSSQFPVPFNYGCIIEKNEDETKKVIKRSSKKLNEDDDDRKAVLDLFTDVTSQSSMKIEKSGTETIEETKDFIPLNSASTSFEDGIKNTNQLYDYYMKNLLYLPPNFAFAPKNPDKIKKKKWKK